MTKIITLNVTIIVDRDTEVMVTGDNGSAKSFC